MDKIFPKKLKSGDKVAVIAPARSLSLISDNAKSVAQKRFDELGLELVFGPHTNESDEFKSSSIESRISDIHWAFSNPDIQGILTVIGGFNSNQLLRYINWDIIKNNPKVFCGFSDITALNNSMFAKTGLVSYSGPHFSSFGQELHFDYTMEYFQKMVMSDEPVSILPSESWSDDQWYMDQKSRDLIPNDGFVVINEGQASGTIIGGNISTYNLLNGTEYSPSFDNAILFLEDDSETYPADFDRVLQSIIHQKGFDQVKGLVIGRFQKESNISMDILRAIIKSKKELNNIPVVAGVDFGHSDPKITYPIGGDVELSAFSNGVTISIINH